MSSSASGNRSQVGKNGVLLTVLGAVAVAIVVAAFLFGGGVFLVFLLIPAACVVGIVRNSRNPNRPRTEGGDNVTSGPLG